MKHLGLVQIILILGVGSFLFGTAGAQPSGLTADQSLPPSAEVGQMVMVTVSLTYNGLNSTQAMVTPSLPSGVVANGGGQSLELYPGITEQVSYPLTAQQSGSYWIVSDISYEEGGAQRSLRLEAPFTAIQSEPSQPQIPPGPGFQEPGASPDPYAPPPGEGEYNGTEEGGYPDDSEPPGGPQTGENTDPGQR
jgi:hypothetical protein